MIVGKIRIGRVKVEMEGEMLERNTVSVSQILDGGDNFPHSA